MNVRVDLVQLDRAIQNGAVRGFDDTTHFLSWATLAIKLMCGSLEMAEDGTSEFDKNNSVIIRVTKNADIFDVEFYIDPSWNALTCPVIETLEEFSLV